MMLPKAPPAAISVTSFSRSSRALGLAAGEDHDAPAVEGALHHVLDALPERGGGDGVLLVDLLRLGLLQEVLGRLHLDDVGAELGGDLGGVGHHVQGGLALLAEAGAARVGPDHRGQAHLPGLQDQRAQGLELDVARAAARIDGVADGGAAQAQGVGHRAGDRRAGLLPLGQAVAVVQLEDQRDVPGEIARPPPPGSPGAPRRRCSPPRWPAGRGSAGS